MSVDALNGMEKSLTSSCGRDGGKQLVWVSIFNGRPLCDCVEKSFETLLKSPGGTQGLRLIITAPPTRHHLFPLASMYRVAPLSISLRMAPGGAREIVQVSDLKRSTTCLLDMFPGTALESPALEVHIYQTHVVHASAKYYVQTLPRPPPVDAAEVPKPVVLMLFMGIEIWVFLWIIWATATMLRRCDPTV